MAAKANARTVPTMLWQSLGSTNARRALVLCTSFALLMAGGFYFVGANFGGARPQANRAMTPSDPRLRPEDPVANFTKTRVGHLLFMPSEGGDCQRLLFDNRNGSLYETKPIPCAHVSAQQGTESGGNEQIMSLRKGFAK